MLVEVMRPGPVISCGYYYPSNTAGTGSPLQVAHERTPHSPAPSRLRHYQRGDLPSRGILMQDGQQVQRSHPEHMPVFLCNEHNDVGARKERLQALPHAVLVRGITKLCEEFDQSGCIPGLSSTELSHIDVLGVEEPNALKLRRGWRHRKFTVRAGVLGGTPARENGRPTVACSAFVRQRPTGPASQLRATRSEAHYPGSWAVKHP